MKSKHLEPLEWRERHPRCNFCEYYKLAIPAGAHGMGMPDFFKCLVKEKTINYSKMPRPWCKCFKVKLEKEFRKELTTNEGN